MTMNPQRGNPSGSTCNPNQLPNPRISRTVATLARASMKPSDTPTASARATPTLCLEAQTSHRLMIMQLTMISGT